jgi:transposase-like protein
MNPELKRRLLARAAEIAGGIPQLASRLSVQEHALRLWLEGHATTPDRVFSKACDLVLEDDILRARHDRRHGVREANPKSPSEKQDAVTH